MSKKKKTGLIVLLMGIALLVVGFALIGDSLDFMSRATETSATITEIERSSSMHKKNSTTYYVYIDYIANGEPVSSYTTEHTSDMKKGDKITIYYDSANPERVRANAVTGEVFFILIGIPVTLVGLIMFLRACGKGSRINRLKEYGRQIDAVITNVVVDTSTSVNDVFRSWVECEAIDPDTRAVRTYKSDRMYEELEHLKGRTVKIYCDTTNSSKYYVDVDSLLKQDD